MSNNSSEPKPDAPENGASWSVSRASFLPLLVWSVMAAASLLFFLHHIEDSTRQMATEQGRSVFRLVESMRVWNAEHSGIYVVQTERDPPNIYLKESIRSTTTITGKPLTLLNPAYMTRQMSGVIEREAGIRLHLTSLNPINPGNKADEWEALALKSFERNSLKEKVEFETTSDVSIAKYIAPLYVKPACLTCHEKQGYKLGDVRGGLSVTWSIAPLLAMKQTERQNTVAIHVALWWLISILIVIGISQQLGHLAIIKQSRASLRALNADLEATVAARTKQLADSIKTLHTISTRAPGIVYQYLLKLDGSTAIPYANDHFFEVFGLQPEEVREDASRLFEFLHPDDVDEIIASTRLSARQLKPWQHEFRIRDAQGRERWMYGDTTPERQPDGTTLWNGFITDITEQKNKAAELVASEAQFRLLFETSLQGVVFQNERGEITDANAMAERILGLTLDQMQGRTSIDPRWFSIHEDGTPFSGEDHPAMVALRTGQKVCNVIMGVYHPIENDTIWIEISSVPQFKENVPTPFRVFTTFTDITERRKSELLLKRHKVIVETAQDGFWMTDATGHIQEVNQAYVKMIGYSAEELLNMRITDLDAHDRSQEELQVHIAKIIAQGHDLFETQHRHKDGHFIDIEVSVTFKPDSKKFFVFCRDITKRKQMEETMRNLAYFDALTGLPNRRMLSDRLSRALLASKRSGLCGALLFMDLDNFKPINDTYGHDAGDELLKEVARRITASVREKDTVSRFGGDEFVVMLADLDEDKAVAKELARAIAEKIRQVVGEPYLLAVNTASGEAKNIEHRCTASIGVGLFDTCEISEQDLLNWADQAMYQSKSCGRNQISFFENNKT